MNIFTIEYVVLSYINGQKKQAINILKSIPQNGKNFGRKIVDASQMYGFKDTVVILHKLGVKDLYIENAFYDYDSMHFDEVHDLITKLNLQ